MNLPWRKRPNLDRPDASAILQALPAPVLVIDSNDLIRFVNAAAEEFFETGAAKLVGVPLGAVMPTHTPVLPLIRQALVSGSSVFEHGIALDTPRIGDHIVDVQVGPLQIGAESMAIMTLHPQSIARKIDHQLVHRNAARSVTAMAAMLMHEVKNPLSGIRGAGQLLEQNAADQDRVLTRLICDETDRIIALIDRMQVFSDSRPIDRCPVNIHAVLEHVRMIAQTGFARHVRFIEVYDPSLPPVYGNRDLLVQVFLNMIKNAAESMPQKGAEITLATAYQHGVRLAVPGSTTRTHLPLKISVKDNGEGIPEDLRPHLFDAFVTTKRNGTGLGLALVAKIVGDHGGVIEFTSRPKRTVFTVHLPMVPADDAQDRDTHE
jgi:two-component system, NtrC family, nitrogen regulation sensor histidine kinase GlnL